MSNGNLKEFRFDTPEGTTVTLLLDEEAIRNLRGALSRSGLNVEMDVRKEIMGGTRPVPMTLYPRFKREMEKRLRGRSIQVELETEDVLPSGVAGPVQRRQVRGTGQRVAPGRARAGRLSIEEQVALERLKKARAEDPSSIVPREIAKKVVLIADKGPASDYFIVSGVYDPKKKSWTGGPHRKLGGPYRTLDGANKELGQKYISYIPATPSPAALRVRAETTKNIVVGGNYRGTQYVIEEIAPQMGRKQSAWQVKVIKHPWMKTRMSKAERDAAGRMSRAGDLTKTAMPIFRGDKGWSDAMRDAHRAIDRIYEIHVERGETPPELERHVKEEMEAAEERGESLSPAPRRRRQTERARTAAVSAAETRRLREKEKAAAKKAGETEKKRREGARKEARDKADRIREAAAMSDVKLVAEYKKWKAEEPGYDRKLWLEALRDRMARRGISENPKAIKSRGKAVHAQAAKAAKKAVSVGRKTKKGRKRNPRAIYEIAAEIRQTWPKVYFGAVPYLEAMGQLGTLDDRYGLDDGDSIVLYFLSNAQTWRGDDARRIKAELKAMLKDYKGNPGNPENPDIPYLTDWWEEGKERRADAREERKIKREEAKEDRRKKHKRQRTKALKREEEAIKKHGEDVGGLAFETGRGFGMVAGRARQAVRGVMTAGGRVGRKAGKMFNRSEERVIARAPRDMKKVYIDIGDRNLKAFTDNFNKWSTSVTEKSDPDYAVLTDAFEHLIYARVYLTLGGKKDVVPERTVNGLKIALSEFLKCTSLPKAELFMKTVLRQMSGAVPLRAGSETTGRARGREGERERKRREKEEEAFYMAATGGGRRSGEEEESEIRVVVRHPEESGNPRKRRPRNPKNPTADEHQKLGEKFLRQSEKLWDAYCKTGSRDALLDAYRVLELAHQEFEYTGDGNRRGQAAEGIAAARAELLGEPKKKRAKKKAKKKASKKRAKKRR